MNARIDLSLIERIAAELAPYRDDEETYIDTLDGATDARDLLIREVSAEMSDRALVGAINAQITTLEARRDRLDMRADAHRRAEMMVLQAMGLTKIELPAATLSIRAGSISVQITDADAIPSQLCTVTTTTAPDKKAIRAQIEAGETVPGAELVRGPDTISVRTK